jgi:predicted GNAT family N-acyltransferase
VAAGGAVLRVEPLDSKRHDRTRFACGEPSLDTYLKTQATQDQRRKACAVFVLVEESEPRVVIGYFTLSAHGLAPGDVPDEAKKHLPRYPQVSATLIGRLAVASHRHGEGLGGALLVRALRKAYENANVVGSSMVVVDALSESAASFYAAHGFVRLPETLRLVLPMHTIGKLLEPAASR